MKSEPPSWLLKALIILSGSSAALTFTVVVPMLSKISHELAHNPVDAYLAKMVSGVVGPAMVVGAAIAGILADKIDRRPVMAGAGLIFAAAGAAPFFLDNLPLILVTRFATGMASIAIATIGAAMVGDHFDEADRPGWMGALSAVGMVTAVVSLPLAGLIADHGWRWPFLLYLCGIPIAALSWIAMRPVARDNRQTTPTVAIRTSKYPVNLIVLALIIGVLLNVPGIYISFYLRDLGAGNPSAVGFALMLNALVAAMLSAVFGQVRRRLSVRSLFYYGFGAVALGLALLAIAHTYLLAIGALLVMGVGMGWLTPNLMSAVADAVDEHHRGRAFGAVNAAVSIAPAIGVTALEPVANRIGIPGILLLTAALGAATAIAVWLQGFSRKATPAGAQD
jgi:MFS family permease